MDVCECVAEEKVQELMSVTTVGISSKTVTMYGYVADDLLPSYAFPVKFKFAPTFPLPKGTRCVSTSWWYLGLVVLARVHW